MIWLTPPDPVRSRGRPAPGLRGGAENLILLACPFCGGAPSLEPHEAVPDAVPEAVRVACRNVGCGVRPGTEYLLANFREELAACWNARLAGGQG